MNPEEIQKVRMDLGITQEKFAQLLGTTTCSVNRWERGHVVPSRLYIKEIKELARNHASYVCRRNKYK